MKNESLYQDTVDILVNAYFNNTLAHGYCTACAVGNIVAANCGFNLERNTMEWLDGDDTTTGKWSFVFMTTNNIQCVLPHLYQDEARRQIDSTGYTWQELAKIEYAFESAPRGKSEDEWMFNGLMAVIDVLDEIHENKELEVTKSTKLKFAKV